MHDHLCRGKEPEFAFSQDGFRCLITPDVVVEEVE